MTTTPPLATTPQQQPGGAPPTARPPVGRTRLSRLEEAVLPPLVALLIALVAGDLLIIAYGESPATVYRLLLEGTWGNWYGFGQVLFKATTLIFTGLAVSVGLRAGLFNIGAEGQLAAGGFAAAMAGLLMPAGTPALLAIPLAMMAGAAGGGAVGYVPGLLKSRFGAHEVIVTIMLNFIVLALLNYLVAAHLAMPESLRTGDIAAGGVPRLAELWGVFHGSAANLTLLIALAAAVAVGWFLFRSRPGYELRAVGLQPASAESGGVRVGATWIRALVISGMLAGLGGINFVLGHRGYYEEGFAAGAGFMGIAVALVGRNHPVGVIIAAFFFATLSQGGLAINAVVPRQLVEVLEGIVILAVAASVPEVRRLLQQARRSTGGGK